MNVSRKDIVATVAVALAAVLYVLWAFDRALPGMDDARITAIAVLVLGFVASAFAVVPGFDGLMHGNKAYLGVTALLGLGALAAGIIALLGSGGVALSTLVAVTVVLWAVSTTHHVLLGRSTPAPRPVEARRREVAGSR
jgi:hypothetical protein